MSWAGLPVSTRVQYLVGTEVGFLHTFPIQLFFSRSGTELMFCSEKILSATFVMYDCTLILEVFVNKINIVLCLSLTQDWVLQNFTSDTFSQFK